MNKRCVRLLAGLLAAVIFFPSGVRRRTRQGLAVRCTLR